MNQCMRRQIQNARRQKKMLSFMLKEQGLDRYLFVYTCVTYSNWIRRFEFIKPNSVHWNMFLGMDDESKSASTWWWDWEPLILHKIGHCTSDNNHTHLISLIQKATMICNITFFFFHINFLMK